MSHPRDEAIIWLSVLLKDKCLTISQAGIWTLILMPPELESIVQDRSAMTLQSINVAFTTQKLRSWKTLL